MAMKSYRWHCNWPHVSSSQDDIIQPVEILADESFLKFCTLPVGEIIHEKKSALLTRPQEHAPTEFNTTVFCELSLEMLDTYRLRGINLICNVNKLEIFEGPLKSYRETVYGMVLNNEGDEEDEGRDEVDSEPVINEVKDSSDATLLHTSCYRYDIDASTIGLTALDIRFITSQSEICILGIRVYYSQYRNTLIQGAGGQASNFPINMINVKKMLEDCFQRPSSQKTAKSEARLHMFLDALESAEIPYSSASSQSSIANTNASSNTSIPFSNPSPTCTTCSHAEANNNDEKSMQKSINLKHNQGTDELTSSQCRYLKEYIDNRLDELERNMRQQIDDLKECQTAKLNKILNLLNTQNKNMEIH